MPTQQCIEVSLSIGPDEYLRLYKGVARNVLARSIDGRKVLFPANILQRYVTREGVRGRFLISFDDAGKFDGICRLA